MKTPEYFRRCKVSFEMLTKNLENIYDLLPSEYKEKYYEDDFLNFRKDFNFLLQGILIDFATTDENIRFLEMLYIADIGDFDTRIDLHLSTKLKSEGSDKWKLIYFLLAEALPEDLLFFKENVSNFLKPIRERMLKSFAVVDYLAGDDYHMTIADDLVSIVENFLLVDGKNEFLSLKEAVDKVNAVLFEPVSNYIEFAKTII